VFSAKRAHAAAIISRMFGDAALSIQWTMVHQATLRHGNLIAKAKPPALVHDCTHSHMINAPESASVR
jgi:hypothetical protein